MNRIFVAPAWLTVLVLAACSGETQLPEATGEGTVRAINAIRTSPSISFLIEERRIAAVEYKDASVTTAYDDLEYTFNFEALLAGDAEPTRIASQFVDVVRDMSYTFLLTGDLATPTLTVWESARTVFDSDATDFQLQLAHTAATLGDYDVYFAPPGTAPVLGQAIGTLSFGETLPGTSFEAGDYVLTLTSADDPGTILFESNTLSPQASTELLFSIFDPDANDLWPVPVRGFNLTTGASFNVVDASITPAVRFYHANIDLGPIDIYVDDPLTTPLVDDQSFGGFTGDLPMPANEVPLTFTAFDNMGSVIFDIDRTFAEGTLNHLYLVKNSSGVDVIVDHIPDRRSIETFAKVSFLNSAALDTNIDVYVVARDELIDETNPILFSLPVALDPVTVTLVEGAFDVYVTRTTEKVALAGPVPLDVVLGDVVEMIIYETGDPVAVDVVEVPLP